MKGQVLDFTIQKNEGVITAENGQRYPFLGIEWKAETSPTRGMLVDFDVDANNHATGIYQALNSVGVNSSSSIHSVKSQKKKSTLTLLTLFLGTFGAHKFYMGSWGWGIVYIVGLFFFISFIPAIVELIRYILMTDEEFYEKVEKYQSGNPGAFSFFW